MSDSEEEQFEDAAELVDVDSIEDLPSVIEDCLVTIKLFFNNHFIEAKNRCKPLVHKSFYHSHGYSTLNSIEAFMTFDPVIIDKALKSCRYAVDMCNKFRKRNSVTESLSNIIKRPNYDLYTDEEVHAELCYAECLLFQSLLTLIQDENLVGLVKSSLKIKSCYQSYRECYQMLKSRTWKKSKEDENFMVGVYLGVGVFNVTVSMLPPRILKLLEFIGFTGDRSYGLAQVDKGHQLQGTLRGILCTCILCSFHLFVTHVFGFGEGDTSYCEKALQPLKELFPRGMFTLLFQGRLEEVKGNFEEARQYFKLAIESQQEWKQLHHLCYWEMMWCHAYSGQWREAWKNADVLLRESRWSRATYGFVKAAFMLVEWESLINEEKAEVKQLMKDIPGWKQKISGKSIPVEKFVIAKANRYLQTGRLVLPVLEFIFMWNGFSALKLNMQSVDMVYQMLEKAEKEVEVGKYSSSHYWDDISLIHLLRGVILLTMKSPLQAEESFQKVCDAEQKIKEETWLIPFTMFEMGRLLIDAGKVEEGIRHIESCRTTYKGYAMETRLHLKIQGALISIKGNGGSLHPQKSERNGPNSLPDLSVLATERYATDQK